MKKKKLLLYVLLPLLAIFLGAFVFLGWYADRVIDPYVRSLLEVTKPMGHNIEYQKIRVNLFKSSIILKDASMFPDSTLSGKDLRMEILVGEIKLTGFSLWQMLFDKTLRIKDLVIENPDVKVLLPEKVEGVVREEKIKKAGKEGSPLLTHVFLEKIIFSGGFFKLIHDTTILAKANDIRLVAQSISLVRNNRQEPVGFTYGAVNLNLSNIDLYSETGLYDLSLKEFSFDKGDSLIVLNGFRMMPKYDKKEFSRKLKFQNDRFDVKIGQVMISGIGISRFLAEGTLEISAILIDNLEADIYRDKNVPFNTNRFPLFYNESFLKIPVPILIDTVAVSNSTITYGELAAEHPVSGTISLEKFSLQMYDLTNQTNDTIDHVMNAFIQAQVMGEGLMKAELILPLTGDLHNFTCSGSIGAMQIKPLNEMLEPSLNIRFNGGKVDRMTFFFNADDNVSKGWMEFLFHDLDVELLKKEPGKEKGFLSAVANWVAVSNNPIPGKPLKTVEIGYERDKNKGIINYIWKTIQSGLVRTVIPTNKHTISRKNQKPEGSNTKGEGKKKGK